MWGHRKEMLLGAEAALFERDLEKSEVDQAEKRLQDHPGLPEMMPSWPCCFTTSSR